jgi:hypothetical protein
MPRIKHLQSFGHKARENRESVNQIWSQKSESLMKKLKSYWSFCSIPYSAEQEFERPNGELNRGYQGIVQLDRDFRGSGEDRGDPASGRRTGGQTIPRFFEWAAS